MKRSHTNTIWCAVAVSVVLIAMPAWCQVLPHFCSSGGKIGPCQGFVDLNANGVYDDGEPLIGFSCQNINGITMMRITNPWSDNCLKDDPDGNLVYFDTDNGSCWTSAHRLSGRRHQQISVKTFNGNNPTAFHFSEDMGMGVSGDGTLQGPDGGLNSLALTGALTMLVGPFEGSDASGGKGDFNHATIPWALSGALGMNGPCRIAPVDPQIFVPVVPLGNGQYQFQFDLCGDSRFCSSPVVSLVAWQGASANIPTVSEWGAIVLVLGLATLGWWFLRRQQVLA